MTLVAREQWRLFGIDLTRLPAAWMQGWREAAAWRPVAALLPRLAVEVHDSAGGVTVRRGASTDLTDAKPAVAAVELADDSVLLHRLALPSLPDEELRSALELEVSTLSPFAPEDTVWGWRLASRRSGPADTVAVTLAIAARPHIDDRLAAVAAELPPGLPVEVWARSGEQVIVLQGFAEPIRRGRERRRLVLLIGQLLLAGALLLLLAATPVLQARQRVFDAQAEFAHVRNLVAEDLRLRDALVERKRQVETMHEHFGDPEDLVGLLGQVTALVPDDAYLNALQWEQDGTVTIRGLAANAAALTERIGSEPGLMLVRAPTAISRDRGTNLESFSIKFSRRAPEAE